MPGMEVSGDTSLSPAVEKQSAPNMTTLAPTMAVATSRT